MSDPMGYDFKTLSPTDFEELVADLLSKEWGTRLEIFKEGKDAGIDLLNSRVPAGEPRTIVQCKRFAPDKFNQLLASIKSEKDKLEKLQPERYVLVTSVPLSGDNKKKLLDVLKPYAKTSGDIYGGGEVNALLRSYPTVEQSHFKLWISSTAVLERVLHAKIFAITDATIEAAVAEIRKLVPHAGLNRALEKINEYRHLLIVGNPGIGKTTLARMLLCHYMRDGFEPVWVSGNLADAWTVVHGARATERKLVLVYDDFLGQLEFSSQRFHKNEDDSLFLLMDTISRSKNLRLILTTREYILEDAKRVHGAFSTRAGELVKCTLSLGDYSNAARGKVLFNHLYFSDLPQSRLMKFLETRVYKRIVQHRHFNPRVVETISRNANSRFMDDDGFIQYVEQEFDNPAKLWEHPFDQEISQLSRQLLMSLWSYGDTVLLSELEASVMALNAAMAPEEVSQQFMASLRQLDGNFISTNRLSRAWPHDDKQYRVVQFQNPSVREFIRNKIKETPAWMLRLAMAAQNFDQVKELLRVAESFEDELAPAF
jgi:DNA polymerase III delta prime subunit